MAQMHLPRTILIYDSKTLIRERIITEIFEQNRDFLVIISFIRDFPFINHVTLRDPLFTSTLLQTDTFSEYCERKFAKTINLRTLDSTRRSPAVSF